MEITPFIRELLFSHDCVIIPGFGGFIGNYTPARIDKSTSTFYPPVKQISFNRNLNHNDGLLIGRISAHSNINYGDARNIVEEFAADIRRKLRSGEKVIFDNIGSFTVNQEGSVQFEPDRNVNYHLDSYGLESFQYSPLEGYDVRKRIIKHIDKEPVKISSMRKILWRAAVIIPLLGLMVAVPLKTNLFKSKVEATTLNPLATAEFENNKKAVDENITEKSPAIPEVIAQPDITVTTSEAVPPSTNEQITIVEENVFYIITGSFMSKENAVNQVNTLKTEGYTPEIIGAPNGFYRVSAMRCNELNLALNKKDSIAKKFPGAWVKRN